MGADCKSADLVLRWFKSSSAQTKQFTSFINEANLIIL